MTLEEKEQTFNATADCVSQVSAFVIPQAEEAGVGGKRQMQLELIIEEVVLNICHYAYETPSGLLTVRVRKEAAQFVVEFEDSGKPFNPLEAKEPDVTLGLEERDGGGLGIFLVRQMADEVHYQRIQDHNRLTLAIKYK